MLVRHKKIIIILLLITGFVQNPVKGTIRIGLVSLDNPLSLTVKICSGQYTVMAGEKHFTLAGNDNILINSAGTKVLVTAAFKNSFLADSVVLQSSDPRAYFSIRNNLSQNFRPREYGGKLVIKPGGSCLLAVNEIDKEKYLRGVVQAEVGTKGNKEYFKTQALLARTYLYMHVNRHINEGYNICDDIHCQAYHGLSSLELINEAVEETSDLVLVNEDSMLIAAPFHSNCGGQTESSENVWLSALPHISNVIDPYCTFSRNARWKKEISLEEWVSYLSRYGYQYQSRDELAFEQLSRELNYSAGSFSYPLTSIRKELGLKSAFFSVYLNEDTVSLEGRGYGHGVGLCQEGARVMSERGFEMQEIIGFYFRDLHIMDIDDVKPGFIITSTF